MKEVLSIKVKEVEQVSTNSTNRTGRQKALERTLVKLKRNKRPKM